MNDIHLEGGCACGAVRYTCDGVPVLAAHCHCRECQRASGAPMVTVFAIPRDALHRTGDTTATYRYVGASGLPVARHFCANCGSPLFTEAEVAPDLAFIRAVSLDHPSQITPSIHVFCESAQPWDIPLDNLPRFPRLPERG